MVNFKYKIINSPKKVIKLKVKKIFLVINWKFGKNKLKKNYKKLFKKKKINAIIKTKEKGDNLWIKYL